MKNKILIITILLLAVLVIKHELNIHELRQRYNKLWKITWDITEIIKIDKWVDLPLKFAITSNTMPLNKLLIE